MKFSWHEKSVSTVVDIFEFTVRTRTIAIEKEERVFAKER
jgi:hypothetical protein